MNVLILCDRKAAGFGLRGQVENAIKQAGHRVQTVELSADELKPCVGCFGCWVKTPGLCVITKDRANEIAHSLMGSDAVVLLSHVVYGGFSADVKAFLDRSIQNILPFFETHRGQMHHKMRYGRFPAWVAVGYGESTAEEREIFRALAERNALNMRPPKHFCLTVQNAGECPAVVRELERIFTEEVGA